MGRSDLHFPGRATWRRHATQLGHIQWFAGHRPDIHADAVGAVAFITRQLLYPAGHGRRRHGYRGFGAQQRDRLGSAADDCPRLSSRGANGRAGRGQRHADSDSGPCLQYGGWFARALQAGNDTHPSDGIAPSDHVGCGWQRRFCNDLSAAAKRGGPLHHWRRSSACDGRREPGRVHDSRSAGHSSNSCPTNR